MIGQSVTCYLHFIGSCFIGTCHDLVASFICSCPPGTAGHLCELNEDDCSEDACHNGGMCIDEVNGFRCECAPGYVGPRCEGISFSAWPFFSYTYHILTTNCIYYCVIFSSR